ncbi:serine hydrolase domain-containing protein, partial [Micromonospora deserti]
MRARFSAVHDCFHDLLAAGRETGASLAIRYDGAPVVELTGGERAPGRPWRPDTLVNVYSVGKPLAALCLLMLVDRGRVDLDDPVAAHWPGFRTPATVRQALTHTAGLPAFPVPRPAAAVADWDLLAADLAGAEPEWTPGSVAGEHAWTYGHLVGELVRRVDGRPVGRFLAEEIAGPWRLDLGFGLDEPDRRRCADLTYGDPGWPVRAAGEPGSLWARAVGNPAGGLDLAVVNGQLWRGAEVPAVNLHATAPALARLYAGLLAGGTLDGVRLFSPDLVAEATRVQYDGDDLLLGRRTRWTLGMQREEDGSWGMG